MKNIVNRSIDELEAGMQLAEDATDSEGVCLVAVGNILNEALISGLKKRGIKEVVIYESVKLTEAEADEKRKDIKDELDYTFKLVEEEKVLRQLKEVFINYRMSEIDG